jgi:hypothetical protein
VCYTPIVDSHVPTGNTKQIIAGKLLGPARGLVICQYDGEESFHLFGCDENWVSLSDTWHKSLEDAKGHAEFEYVGTSSTWVHLQ